MSSTNSIGKLGESVASTHLLGRGFKILERNWRFGKKEIDIIAEIEELIVFIEVKTREEPFPGRLEEYINRKKQKHIISAANEYIRLKDIDKEGRFDVIAIVLNRGNHEIEHIEEAFYPLL
ncbi:MAG TPA: YraN family protein [Cryomorphaceae bacterium]|nr:YraN family protein [Cryomorphaceae bacterium]